MEPALEQQTVLRLRRQYRVLLKVAQRKYPWVDPQELYAVWEDTLWAAYQSLDTNRSSERTWVNRRFRQRLSSFLRQRDPIDRPAEVALGTDPKILNGINPEQAFWQSAAMNELLKLEPRMQTIVVTYLHGYTFEEVAEMVGVSKSRAHREYQEALILLRARFGVCNGGKDRG